MHRYHARLAAGVATILTLAASSGGCAPTSAGGSATGAVVQTSRSDCQVVTTIFRRGRNYEDAVFTARQAVYAAGGNAYRVVARTGTSVTVEALRCGLQDRNYLRDEGER